MPHTIYVDLDRTGCWFTIQSPYDAGFVEALKTRLPSTARRWEPEYKSWCVIRSHWNLAQSLLRIHYGADVVIEAGPGIEAAEIDLMLDEVMDTATAYDYATLGIRVDSPECVIHAAYRALAVEAEGDAESRIMQGIAALPQLRKAYERVCEQRGVYPHT